MDDVSRGEDVKVAIKRSVVVGASKMGKKNINRAPARKSSVVSKLSQGADLLQIRVKCYQ